MDKNEKYQEFCNAFVWHFIDPASIEFLSDAIIGANEGAATYWKTLLNDELVELFQYMPSEVRAEQKPDYIFWYFQLLADRVNEILPPDLNIDVEGYDINCCFTCENPSRFNEYIKEHLKGLKEHYCFDHLKYMADDLGLDI